MQKSDNSDNYKKGGDPVQSLMNLVESGLNGVSSQSAQQPTAESSISHSLQGCSPRQGESVVTPQGTVLTLGEVKPPTKTT